MTLQEQLRELDEAMEPIRVEVRRLCEWLLRHPWLVYLMAAFVAVVAVVGIVEELRA